METVKSAETGNRTVKSLLLSAVKTVLNSDRWAYSEWYIFAVYLSVVFFWLLRAPLVGIACIVVLISFFMLTKRDLTPLMPVLFSSVMLFHDIGVAYGVALYVIVSPAVAALIAHFFIFPPKKEDNPLLGNLFFPLLTVSVVFFTGGLFSKYLGDYLSGIASMISLGVGLLLIYVILRIYIRPPESVDLKRYLAVMLTFLPFIGLYQLFVNKLTFVSEEAMGWGVFNTVGALSLIAVPACFYLSLKQKVALPYMFTAAALYGLTIISGSDGAAGILIISFPFVFYFVYKRYSPRNRFYFRTGVIIAVFFALLFAAYTFRGQSPTDIFDYIYGHFVYDTGRTPIYKKGLELFSKNPVFGVGLGYTDESVLHLRSDLPGWIFNFHCTVIQVLATMGIAGFIAYAYYTVERIKILTAKFCDFNFFIFLGFLLFECYGMIDACEFNMIPCMVNLTVTLLFVEIINVRDAEKPSEALPLTHVTC